jgi:hypothetical protein
MLMILLRVLEATVRGTRTDPGQTHLRARQHQVPTTSYTTEPRVMYGIFVVRGVAKRHE